MTSPELLERIDTANSHLSDLIMVLVTMALDQSSHDLKNMAKETGCLHNAHNELYNVFKKHAKVTNGNGEL